MRSPPPPTSVVALVAAALVACGATEKLGFGASCSDGGQCASGQCFQSRCSKVCSASTQCSGGICVDKLCAPLDRVPCGGDDVCEELMPPAGPCQNLRCAQSVCRLLPKANQTPCGDSLCDAPKLCSAGMCAATPGAATPACDDGNVCTHDTCSPKTGCASVPNTLPCDDDKFCTAGEACAGGVCKGGKPVACIGGNACALVLCSESAKGCTATKPSGGPCDDGDPCTAGDSCLDGKCKAGSAAACTDGNACTNDVCGSTGKCTFAVVDDGVGCNDGDVCTLSDQCMTGACVAGPQKVCDDEKQCTQDKCVGGDCTFALYATAEPCDDGDPCTGWGACDNGVCKKGVLGVWSLVEPIVPNLPHAAVAVDVRGGILHIFGSEPSGGKFEVSRYQLTPAGVALAGTNYSDADWGLFAAAAAWMPVPGTPGAHVVVGTAAKPSTQLAAFVVTFAIDNKVAPKLSVVPDTFAKPSTSLGWRAVDVQLPNIWVAGEYGSPEPTKPYVARLNTDLTVAMQTVLDDATQGADFFEVRDIAAEPDGSGAIVVGRVTNGVVQTGYARRVTLALQPDWKATPVSNGYFHAITRYGEQWLVAGSFVQSNGIAAIAVRALHDNGTWGWQQVHPIGIGAAAHALLVAPGGKDLYFAGWAIPEAGSVAAPLIGRLTGLGMLVEYAVLPTTEKARLDAIALNESATQVVAVGVHGPNEKNTGMVGVAANAFAQAQCANSGACTGQAVAACDDGKPCTFDSCAQGKCTHLPMPDATPCATAAVCQGGLCGP